MTIGAGALVIEMEVFIFEYYVWESFEKGVFWGVRTDFLVWVLCGGGERV